MSQATLLPPPPKRCPHCALEIATCEYCREDIVFGVTEKGARMPMDAKVRQLMVRLGELTKIGKREVLAFSLVKGHAPHFGSCPKYPRESKPCAVCGRRGCKIHGGIVDAT